MQPLMGVEHGGQHGLDGVERAVHVDGEVAMPQVVGDVLEQAWPATPALFTSRDTGPKASSRRRTISLTWARSDTSARRARARQPEAVSSGHQTVGAVLPDAVIHAHGVAVGSQLTATARPMPREAPVTSAIFSIKTSPCQVDLVSIANFRRVGKKSVDKGCGWGNILSLSARLAQLVEHMLDVHGVTGSSPVPRPLETPRNHMVSRFFFAQKCCKISGKCVVFAAKRVDNGYRQKGGQRRMEDWEIIRLLFERSEGGHQRTVRRSTGARKLSNCRRHSERPAGRGGIVNDAWLGVEQHSAADPRPLRAYICRIARNCALKRLRANSALKRGSQFEVSRCPSWRTASRAAPWRNSLQASCPRRSTYSSPLSRDDRVMFVKRYWFAER